jgi:hypothetical protein
MGTKKSRSACNQSPFIQSATTKVTLFFVSVSW